MADDTWLSDKNILLREYRHNLSHGVEDPLSARMLADELMGEGESAGEFLALLLELKDLKGTNPAEEIKLKQQAERLYNRHAGEWGRYLCTAPAEFGEDAESNLPRVETFLGITVGYEGTVPDIDRMGGNAKALDTLLHIDMHEAHEFSHNGYEMEDYLEKRVVGFKFRNLRYGNAIDEYALYNFFYLPIKSNIVTLDLQDNHLPNFGSDLLGNGENFKNLDKLNLKNAGLEYDTLSYASFQDSLFKFVSDGSKDDNDVIGLKLARMPMLKTLELDDNNIAPYSIALFLASHISLDLREFSVTNVHDRTPPLPAEVIISKIESQCYPHMEVFTLKGKYFQENFFEHENAKNFLDTIAGFNQIDIARQPFPNLKKLNIDLPNGETLEQFVECLAEHPEHLPMLQKINETINISEIREKYRQSQQIEETHLCNERPEEQIQSEAKFYCKPKLGQGI